MALIPPTRIKLQRVASPDEFHTLLRTFDGLPNNPASLYLSNTSHDLIIYVAPTRVVNSINISYLSKALSIQEKGASALKSFLETGAATLVFFDARKTAKILFENDHAREWLASLDKCITRDSDLDIDALIPDDWIGINQFDARILHLPVLWKKYHDQLHASHYGFAGGGFWVAKIRTDTRLRLAVSCGETHYGYGTANAYSHWDKDRIDEETEIWNDAIMDSGCRGGVGGEHWAKFSLL
ncbi:unnamed protein product [Alternaria alternata]